MFKRITSLLLTLIMLIGVFTFQLPAKAAESCTIAFDANGGTEFGIPDDITVEAGSVITLPASSPTKPGMVFMGWAFSKEEADTGVITYAAGTTPQILVNSSATLYASFAYSVVLNHGNRGWGNAAVQQYKYPGKDLELFHKKDLIHANYGMLPGASGETTNLMVFMEWNTAQDSNGNATGIGYHEKYTANAATTLYCIWGNPISYNANGGTFPATGTDRQSKYVVNWSLQKHNDTTYSNFDFPDEENVPTKAGARLVTNDAGETVYAIVYLNGNIYRMETKDSWLDMPIFNGPGHKWEDFYTYILPIEERALELYAIWEPSVTYKANGGEGADVVEYMEHVGPTLFSYADYTILDNPFTSEAGFLNWNTKPDGSGESYEPGDIITGYDSSDPVILYAQWDATQGHTKDYTVSFNAMEGYLPFENQSYEIAYGESYADAFELPVPTRSGYLFKGWYNEETESYLNYDLEIYSLNGDTSFTAVWERHDNHYLEPFKIESTCITEGSYTESCSVCGYYNTITYDKIGHTFTDWSYTGDGENVKRYCTLCGCSEDDQIPPSVNQQIIAYINKSVAYKNDDFPYIDVLNYLGPAIDGGPGEYPFQQSYFGEAAYMRQVASARNPNIKIVCTIFNRNIVKFENWLRTPALRAEFANHLTGVVFANNFDGLDIDFEFPQDLSLRDEFALFLGEVRARFNARTASTGRQYILSIATPAAHWATEKYDLVACAEYLDYFNIMNYDLYCGTAVPYTHHHTPPFDNIDPFGHVPTGGSVQGDINMYKGLGIPGDKIVSGMGLYSREWNGVPNRNNGLFMPAALQASNLHYDLLVASYINRNGYTRYWDDTSKAPYLFNPSTGIFFSYEDPESIKYKCQIVAKERVRGVMVFDYVTCDGAGIFGYIRSQMGSVLHSCSPGNKETKAASCTENGYTKTYCYFCDALIKHTEIYHEGHYATDFTVVTPADKGTAGIEKATCLKCNEEFTREIPALGYTVTFDGVGGTVKSSTKYILQKGESYYDKIGGVPIAERDGYSFTGWYDAANAKMFNITESFEADSDIIFEAQWVSGDIDDGHEHSYTETTVREANCTEGGIIRFICTCGSSYTETTPALGHSWGDWKVTVKPTAKLEGEQQRECTVCHETETEVIPAIGYVDPAEVTAQEMTVIISNAQNVDVIKYALGRHITDAALEAAGAAAITDVASKAENGIFTVDLTEEGTYTFAVTMIDGRTFFNAVDVKKAVEPDIPVITEPEATAEGAVVTISGLTAEVKDVFLAKGEYDNYTDVNANKIVRLTQNKLKGAQSYDYTVPAGGVYTVLVRYNDGTMKYAYVTVDVVEPTMSANGLQITVKNLEGVKVIRTAYGTYKTGAQIKAAEGSRAFTAKGVLKGVDEYTIQYRDNGTATIAVCYENGYMKIFVVEIQQ
ncbi:MAG: hypothetical protein E7591_08915, partial [Ruminococcaceae bacterium]|nr:hypothetical protein [Oscillospiraceae bacterium]